MAEFCRLIVRERTQIKQYLSNGSHKNSVYPYSIE